jgi:Ser-tRNA(Ala) deacylase AlaX
MIYFKTAVIFWKYAQATVLRNKQRRVKLRFCAKINKVDCNKANYYVRQQRRMTKISPHTHLHIKCKIMTLPKMCQKTHNSMGEKEATVQLNHTLT